MFLSHRAQSMMEYVVLISIIVAAIVYMLPAIKRTSQSMIKSAADQIGDQAGAEQEFNVEKGYLMSSNTSSSVKVDNLRTDHDGEVSQTYDEATVTKSNSLMAAGFTETE